MVRRTRFCVLFALLIAVSSAQDYRGTLLGRVKDPSGASVPGARISATNEGSGTTTSAGTTDTGDYQIPFLLPGTYRVTVEREGFRRLERSGVRVSTGSQTTLDLSLELGSATESVTVTADALLLNTANADLSTTVENRLVQSVEYTLSRNIATIALMVPGVVGLSGSAYTYSANTYTDISINGGGGDRGGNEYLVDGIPNVTAGGNPVFMPTVDAVDEFKVHTTMFDASLGHTNGGVISISTKGGGNDLHGTAYFFKRWAALNANGWTNNRLGLPKSPVNYYQIGWQVSGPVWLPKLYNGHNRTFFSVALERDREPRPITRQGRVPTALERAGDFSQTLNRLGGAFAIYDPSTTIVTGGNRATRQIFPGARIPANRVDPSGAAILAQYPTPNQVVSNLIGAQNWAFPAVYEVRQRNVSARIDHVISDRQRLFGRYGRTLRDQDPDIVFPGWLGGNSRQIIPLWNVGVDDTVTFSPSLVGSFRLGVVRRGNSTTRGGAGSDPAILKLPAVITQNQALRGWPTIGLAESFPSFGSVQSLQYTMLYTGMATITKISGPHSTKFGVDYRLGRWNENSPGQTAQGNFTFNNQFTRSDPFTAASGDTSGSSMTSLLLGLPASGSFGYSSPFSLQNHYLALFAQEDWKINSRLTVNLGLRYDLETPFTERYDRMTYGFDANAKLPLQVSGLDLRGGVRFVNQNGLPRRGGSVDTNNFGPRAGFAYRLGSRMAVRGGFGLFYGAISNNSNFHGQSDVFNAITQLVGSNDGGATPFATLANPFPNGLVLPVGVSAGLTAQVGNSLSIFEDKRVLPYNEQWQLSVQRELPSRMVAEITYLGMHSLKEIESFDLNEKPDAYLALGSDENRAIPNPFLGVFPANTVLGQGATIPQSRLWGRFPQFTSMTIQGENTGAAMYHALQFKVEKRVTHGLNFLFSHTFSRLMENNTTSLINARHYRAVSGNDQKHVMRLGFVYQLPSPRGLLLRQIGGWQIAGHADILTGNPLTVTQTNGRPLRIRNPRIDGPTQDHLGDRFDPVTKAVLNPYFDTGAFKPLASQYTVTPEPPFLDELRAPITKSLFLSLNKEFPIRERLRLAVNLEADNALNTTSYNAPGTNMNNAATFGIISGARPGRTMMGSLRVRF